MAVDTKTIGALNKMLEQEHACAIRYHTHAAVLQGPYAEPVAARLREIGQDELRHAEMLRARITALGGEPSMQVSTEDLIMGTSLEEILAINIKEEKGAIKGYIRIFEQTSPTNAILYEALQDLIKDEQEHLEELEALQSQD